MYHSFSHSVYVLKQKKKRNTRKRACNGVFSTTKKKMNENYTKQKFRKLFRFLIFFLVLHQYRIVYLLTDYIENVCVIQMFCFLFVKKMCVLLFDLFLFFINNGKIILFFCVLCIIFHYHIMLYYVFVYIFINAIQYNFEWLNFLSLPRHHHHLTSFSAYLYSIYMQKDCFQKT